MSQLTAELTKAVKGAREIPHLAHLETAELVVDAERAYHEAVATPMDIKSVAGPLQPFMQRMGWSPQAAGLDKSLQEIQKVLADLGKEITLTSPLSTSFAVYDLQAPAKKTFPVLSPFRNRLPRVAGEGTATHWKVISAISGSGGSLAPINHFVGELPNNTVGGFTGNLPPEIAYAANDATKSFQPIGLSSSASMIATFAGRGYQDLRELAQLSTLQSLMLSEERGLWSGRTTAVGAPTITTAAQTPSTGFTALTGVTTDVYVKVTAVTMMGESVPSGASTVAPTGTQDVLVTITPATGANAEAFNIYASTGASDPGDASRFFQGSTGYNVFELGGALQTTGKAVPTADSTASTNADTGVYAQLEGGVHPNVTTLNRVLALADLDNAMTERWNYNKAAIGEIWLNVFQRRMVKDLVLSNGTNANGYRIEIDQHGTATGLSVSAVLNPAVGAGNVEVPLTTHPWMPLGSVVGLSYQLPFPNTEIPNLWEVKGPQDYMAIDWPVIDMNYRNSVIAYQALIGYGPDFNFWIRGAKSNYGAGTSSQ